MFINKVAQNVETNIAVDTVKNCYEVPTCQVIDMIIFNLES